MGNKASQRKLIIDDDLEAINLIDENISKKNDFEHYSHTELRIDIDSLYSNDRLIDIDYSSEDYIIQDYYDKNKYLYYLTKMLRIIKMIFVF